jgi:hypothetical protein
LFELGSWPVANEIPFRWRAANFVIQLSKTTLTKIAPLTTIADVINHIPRKRRALCLLEVDRPNDLGSSSFTRKN